VLLFATATVAVLALATVFAIELSGSLSTSRTDLERTFRQKAQLTASLTQSVFGSSASASAATTKRTFGGSGAALQTAVQHAAGKQHSPLEAVLDASGRVLASVPPEAATLRPELPAVARNAIRFGTYLTNIFPLGPGGRGEVEFAQAFGAPPQQRVVVSAFDPKLLAAFLSGYLTRAVGANRRTAYLVDSNGAVLGSSSKVARIGGLIGEPGLAAAVAGGNQGAYGDGRWFATAPVGGSSWRVALTASSAELFAPVSGSRKVVPWLIFLAFVLVAATALLLGRRVLRATELVHDSNERLAEANTALADANGQLADANASLATANDSLERRAAELARSNSELQHFASVASHDLQEPLRKVRTFTQRLTDTESATLSEYGKDYLVRANAAAERMQWLIEDLLKYSRVSTNGRPFATVDLGVVVAEVLSDLEHQIDDARAEVNVGELPTVSGDATQLRQLMQNLLSNAIKFRRRGVAPVVNVDADVRDGFVVINVRDNGIGFEREYAAKIFKVFERLHSRTEYAGTGIGLALCRKIAERHGGTVVAESVLGEGSTFTVTIDGDRTEAVIESLPEPEVSYARL
jgi:signal transduction histidine kinase